MASEQKAKNFTNVLFLSGNVSRPCGFDLVTAGHEQRRILTALKRLKETTV